MGNNDYAMSYEDSMAGMLDEARARVRQLRVERVELRAKCEDLEVWCAELRAKLEAAERERDELRGQMRPPELDTVLRVVLEEVDDPDYPDGKRAYYVVYNGSGKVCGSGYTPQWAVESVEWDMFTAVPEEG